MSQIFAKPIVGDDPLSVLRREVCTMGGCPEGTAECFCAEIGRLNVELSATRDGALQEAAIAMLPMLRDMISRGWASDTILALRGKRP